jgi:hypothetical protein
LPSLRSFSPDGWRRDVDETVLRRAVKAETIGKEKASDRVSDSLLPSFQGDRNPIGERLVRNIDVLHIVESQWNEECGKKSGVVLD